MSAVFVWNVWALGLWIWKKAGGSKKQSNNRGCHFILQWAGNSVYAILKTHQHSELDITSILQMRNLRLNLPTKAILGHTVS